MPGRRPLSAATLGDDGDCTGGFRMRTHQTCFNPVPSDAANRTDRDRQGNLNGGEAALQPRNGPVRERHLPALRRDGRNRDGRAYPEKSVPGAMPGAWPILPPKAWRCPQAPPLTMDVHAGSKRSPQTLQEPERQTTTRRSWAWQSSRSRRSRPAFRQSRDRFHRRERSPRVRGTYSVAANLVYRAS